MRQPEDLTQPPLAEKLMQGTIWTVAMRWGVRLLGIVSMVVLVRLLQPEDFGLIAMAMAVVALVDSFTDFGIVWALVRNKDAGRDQFDTAWTVRQGQLAFVALVVFLAAPLASALYDDPRIVDVLRVIAVSFVIRGFENIGVVEFQRQLQFHKDFVFRVLVKVIGVAVTIALALWLRSYWALALGMLSKAITSVTLSYWFSSYRPRWTLKAWRELWAFSQWILTQGFARYIYENAPVLFLGRLTTAESVGYYTVSGEIAALPASEISLPVSRAVLPGFAKLVDEPERLKRGYLKALGAVATVTLPLCLGMASVSPELVRLVLGGQWLPAIGLIQIFAIFATFRALDSLTGNLLIVIDRVRSFAVISWVQAIILVAGIVPAYDIASLEGVAYLRAFVSLVGLVLLTSVVAHNQIARWPEILKLLHRPLAAALLMTATLYFLNQYAAPTPDSSPLQLAAILLLKTIVGAAIYSSTVFAMWRRAGKPDSLESMLVEKITNMLQRKSQTTI